MLRRISSLAAITAALVPVSLFVAVSVASACVVQVAADCGNVYVNYAKFPARGTSHVYIQISDVDVNNNPTSVGSPKLDYPVTDREGNFTVVDQAASGTVRRDITFSFVSYKNSETKTAQIAVPNCTTTVTPPVAPPVVQPPVVTPPVTPPAVVTPPATPATPVPATPVTPKPVPPVINLKKGVTSLTAGEYGVYTIVGMVSGNDTANVWVHDRLPAGVTLTKLPKGATMHGDLIFWNTGFVAKGHSFTLKIPVKLDANVLPHTLCNTAGARIAGGKPAHSNAACTPTKRRKTPPPSGGPTG